MSIFIVFEKNLWLTVGITILLASIIFYFAALIDYRKPKNFIWCLMMIFNYGFGKRFFKNIHEKIPNFSHIGLYAHHNPRRPFVRVFIAGMLFMGLNLNAAYTGYLLNVLTTPRYDHQVSNIYEAIESGYEFTGGENLKALFELGRDSASEHLRDYYTACFEIDKCLLGIKTDKKLAIAISRQHSMNAKVPITDEDMFCFEKADNIFSFSVVMLFKRDHHLLPLVNTLIRRITEYGFILKWRSDAEYEKLKEVVKRVREKAAEGNQAINVAQLFGLFAVGGAGVLLALIVFIIEWIVFYFAQKKKIKFVRKYIEAKFFYS